MASDTLDSDQPAALQLQRGRSTFVSAVRRIDRGALALCLGTAILFAFSNPRPSGVYDQPLMMARLFLAGKFGSPTPIDYLEFAPGDSGHFSVFAIGSIVLNMPFAVLERIGLISENPVRFQMALLGFLLAALSWFIARLQGVGRHNAAVLVLLMCFGTWAWCNIAFGSAWFLSLGYAMVGELGFIAALLAGFPAIATGAIFTVALAYRFELNILLPVLAYLVGERDARDNRRSRSESAVQFLLFPAIHLLAQLLYNLLRFGSFFDMGYARLYHAFDIPNFRGGNMSLLPLWENTHMMLLQGWPRIGTFPYFRPPPWGSSIVIACPALVLAIPRWRAALPVVRAVPLLVLLASLAFLLHGGNGALQYSYRFAMTLIPWLYLLWVERVRQRLDPTFLVLTALSITVNSYALYAFFWST